MRVFAAALWPLERPADDIGIGVFLDEEGAKALASLNDGERILLVEPNELQAEAIARLVEIGGRRFWFGEIGDERAIQVIYPGPTATAPCPTEA